MILESGGLIEINDYNEIALLVNRIFSNITPDLDWATSGIVLDETVGSGGEPAGTIKLLSPEPNENDFLVVVIDGVTQVEVSDYEILYSESDPARIRFFDALPENAEITVYNRQTHRIGWGQQASVFPVDPGDPVLADEAELQAYLEANINNLIDKVNIMEDRTGGPTQLTRIAQGKLIEYTDKTLIQSTINNDIFTSSNLWQNEIATATGEVESFTRTNSWANLITGTMRYTWQSYDHMRFFFNTGCEIRADIAMTGEDTNQGYVNWSQTAEAMGTLGLNYTASTHSGRNGIREALGAYDLTTSWQTIFTSGSPELPVDENGDFDAYGSYSSLVMVWDARIVPDSPEDGNVSIDIRVTMDDQDLNQTFVGTTTYRGGYLVADDVTESSAVFSVTGYIPTLSVQSDFS